MPAAQLRASPAHQRFPLAARADRAWSVLDDASTGPRAGILQKNTRSLPKKQAGWGITEMWDASLTRRVLSDAGLEGDGTLRAARQCFIEDESQDDTPFAVVFRFKLAGSIGGRTRGDEFQPRCQVVAE